MLLSLSWYPVEIKVFKGFLDFLDVVYFTSVLHKFCCTDLRIKFNL